MNAARLQNDLLDRMDHDNICQLPCNNDVNLLAVHARNSRITHILTGKLLIKENIKHEAHRLQIDDKRIINLAVDHVWDCLTPFQQEQFTALANNANNINQAYARVNNENLKRITQINIYQATNDPFEDALFNGTSNF